MARTISVQIIGDSRSLERAFARSEKSAQKFSRNMESAGRGTIAASVGFKGLGRAVGYASASFLGAAGFVAAAKAGFNEMLEGQKVAAQTAAAIKSTGAVAGVTAGHIDKLATSLQKMSGYDDEAIQSAENLLLTFTNVRNVAGRNNDIFDQTTLATLNLSRTFDQDLSASAVQLGKALQDPVRGVTALRRIGVSFTEAQQNLINRLVRTGDVLGAQKIILQEVNRETGNAARAYGQTFAGQLDILQGNLANLAGELAKKLNPEVKKLTERFNTWLENPENKQKIIDGFATGIHDLGVAAHYAAEGFKLLAGAGNSAGQKAFGAWDWLTGGNFKRAVQVAAAAKRVAERDRSLDDLAGPVGKPGGSLLPQGLAGPVGRGAAPPGTPRPAATPKGVTAAQRNTWFDQMIGRLLGRAGDPTSLRAQITRYRQIAGLLTQRLAVTKDITRRLNLEDQLANVAISIRDRQDQIADKARDAAAARREDQMGWLDFAIERAGATKTLADDRSALRAKEKFLKALVAHEKRNLQDVSELWRTRQQIKDLNKKNADVDPLAGLVQVSTRRLTNMLAAGTGLGVAGRQQLGRNIAGAEIRPVYVGVNIDGREVGRAVTTDQARTGRRTSRQTSGYRG